MGIRKFIYLLLMKFSKKKNGVSMVYNTTQAKPAVPFYSLSAVKNNGEVFSFEALKGKKVLLVNTASACGYTPQYDELEKLYETYKQQLVVIAFPANDFGAQEQGSDDEIAQFCKVNFGVTFPLMKKSGVVKNAEQNPVFEWLTNKNKNGWNDKQPTWNFCKYLVDENGVLQAFFAQGVSPLDAEVIKAVEQTL
jgi:glutathione peroxidase